MWKVVSSSSLYNLQTVFSLKMPIVCRCFLRLQLPVISLVTVICSIAEYQQPVIGMAFPPSACSVCDLLRWYNVSGVVV
jgi:hypothetical protein